MINPDEIKVDYIYFFLSYYDEACKIPDITTYVYIGMNLEEPSNGQSDLYYFQDPESYLKNGIGIVAGAVNEEAYINSFEASLLVNLYTLEALVRELQRGSNIRK